MLPEITLEWLEARVRADDDGCWIWTGYTTKHGQPQARLNYQLILVRRVVWEMTHDKELKSTMWVAAKCNKPGCCHPDCMVARTRSQALKGRGMTLLHRAAIATAKRRNSDIPDEVVAEVRASVCLWVPALSEPLEPLTFFGWCKEFEIAVQYTQRSLCALEIEGMA